MTKKRSRVLKLVMNPLGSLASILSRNNVHSVNIFNSKNQRSFVKRLNKKEIKWIVKEFERRNKGIYTIARMQGITPQHVCRIYRKYKNCKDPVLLKPGRKPKEITKQERALVIQIHKKFKVGAMKIEQILNKKSIKISHNRIHKILLEEDLAKNRFGRKQLKRPEKFWNRIFTKKV